ncbi:MAG: hypothetical protein ABIW58_03895 [Sphingomicrobium sp.]
MLTATAALLAGCGGPGPVADDPNAGAGLPNIAEVENVSGVRGTPLPSDGGPPIGGGKQSGTTLPQPGATIPAFLHGRWGMTPADCTSTRGDAKGLLTITAKELRFFESRAVPVGNVGGSDDSFTADFAFTGEGQTWTGFETLELQDRKLVRTTSGPMASYSYAKCD